MLKEHILDLVNEKIWRGGPAIWVLTSPAGLSRLRTTHLAITSCGWKSMDLEAD